MIQESMQLYGAMTLIVHRANGEVGLAASRATRRDFETGSAAWPSSGKASGP